MAKESKLQNKIMGTLENDGFIAINLIVASKSGHSDIIACSPNGKFLAIEVKDDDVPRKLQEYRLLKYKQNNAVAFWCDSFAMFTCLYNQAKSELIS